MVPGVSVGKGAGPVDPAKIASTLVPLTEAEIVPSGFKVKEDGLG